MSKRPEIVVREAARQINCSERTILNLIKMKRFEAIKVGREWFIDYASFLSFAKRYKYNLVDDEIENEIEIDEKDDKKSALMSRAREVKQESSSEKFTENSTRKRKYGNILTLRVYQIFKDIFESGNFKDVSLLAPREAKIIDLGEGVLENLGAGFYGFGSQTKRMHYSKARAGLGAIIALLYSDDDLRQKWSEEIQQIEERLLPAFGALIKKLEQSPYRNRYEEIS